MPTKNLGTFLGCDWAYEEARIAVFGAPFDSTTSYRPGARFASRHMRAESPGLETFSPYQHKDLAEAQIFDCGDLELSFGAPEPVLNTIESFTAELLADGKLPVMIGGEHLLTLGAVRAVLKKHPDLRIIHFDAHADLRDDYLGQKLSHATVMRRIWEIIGDGRIYQFGIRSGDGPEFAWGAEHVQTRRFDLEGLADLVQELKSYPVYFTLDLDVLDPAFFPGTGTPEPGGIFFKELLSAILHLAPLNIVGCDLMELAPNYDQSGLSTITACKAWRELMLVLETNNRR